MNAAPSRNNIFTSILSRAAVTSIAAGFALALLLLATAPAIAGDVPPDQIKAAGAIPLTTELLDKMDKFIKSASSDAAVKAELAEVGKDPSMDPDKWGSVITAKCPKAVALFKDAGITPDEFSKGVFAIMAVAMSEELAKSDNATVKANAEFVAANKERAEAVFGGFMGLAQ